MEKYVQPFINTCCNVFRDFIGLEITASTPHFVEQNDSNEWDISGIIGLAGEAQGAVVLSLKKELAFKLTEKLTGMEYTETNEDVFDAVGEIINIIAGNVKRDLEEMFQLVISLPTIIEGQNHNMVWLKSQGARRICIPFKVLDTHAFSLFVSLRTN